MDEQIDFILENCGSDYVNVLELQKMLERIFERNLYVQSMEVFEMEREDSRPLRVDLSIMGFDDEFDERAMHDKELARRVIDEKLAAIQLLKNEFFCKFWLDELSR